MANPAIAIVNNVESARQVSDRSRPRTRDLVIASDLPDKIGAAAQAQTP